MGVLGQALGFCGLLEVLFFFAFFAVPVGFGLLLAEVGVVPALVGRILRLGCS
jgi:hypothetical protein